MQAGSVAQTKEMFPNPPAFASRATAIPAHGFFTNHESRDTKHGVFGTEALQSFFGADLPGMRREERFVMSRDTSSMARAKARCTVPQAFARRATAGPANRFFTNHYPLTTIHCLSTRITAFSQSLPRCPVHHCSRLFTIVHDCSPLFAIVQQKNIVPASVRAPPAFWLGLTAGLHVSPRGERKMSLCQERKTFSMARTGERSISP